MKILLLLVGSLVLAAARPAKPNTRVLKEFMSQMFSAGHHQRRQVSDGSSCTELADAVGDLVHFMLTSGLLPPNIMNNIDTVTKVVERMNGFDSINDGQGRREFFCSIADSESIADLKMRLDELDFNFNHFRGYYDFVVSHFNNAASLGNIPEDMETHMLTMKSLGLLDLDPEGVELYGQLLFGATFEPAVHAVPSSDSLHEQCQTLQNLVDGQIRGDTAATILMITGVNVYDKAELDSILCDILHAGDLRGIYNVMESRGMIDQMYRIGYPLVIQDGMAYKTQLEMILQAMDMGEQHPGMGGQHPGMGGQHPGMGGQHPGMGGQHPGMGGQHPGMGGQHPGMGGQHPGMEQILIQAKLMLRVVEKLEATGLLSLH